MVYVRWHNVRRIELNLLKRSHSSPQITSMSISSSIASLPVCNVLQDNLWFSQTSTHKVKEVTAQTVHHTCTTIQLLGTNKE